MKMIMARKMARIANVAAKDMDMMVAMKGISEQQQLGDQCSISKSSCHRVGAQAEKAITAACQPSKAG